MTDLLIPTSGYRELTIEEILRRKAVADARDNAVPDKPSEAKMIELPPGVMRIDSMTARYPLPIQGGYMEVVSYDMWAPEFGDRLMSAPDLYRGFEWCPKELRDELRVQFSTWGIVVNSQIKCHFRMVSGVDVLLQHARRDAPVDMRMPSNGFETNLLELSDYAAQWYCVRQIFGTDESVIKMKSRLSSMSGGLPVILSRPSSNGLLAEQLKALAFTIDLERGLCISAVDTRTSKHYARTVRYD